MTTIKKMLDSARFPWTEDGKAQRVPMRGGGVALIVATNVPGERPLVGWAEGDTSGAIMRWSENGRLSDFEEFPTDLVERPRKFDITLAIEADPTTGHVIRVTQLLPFNRMLPVLAIGHVRTDHTTLMSEYARGVLKGEVEVP